MRAWRPMPQPRGSCARSNGVGSEADIDSVRERRDVQAEGALADRVQEALIGPLAALVPGHVQARGVPPCVLDERVEIGGLLLVGVHAAQLPRPPRMPCVAKPDPMRALERLCRRGSTGQADIGVRAAGGEEGKQLEPVAALVEVEVGDQHGRFVARGLQRACARRDRR